VLGASANELWGAARRDVLVFAGFIDGVEVHRRGHGLLMITGGPAADFNVGLVDAGPDDAATLRDFVARVRDVGVPAMIMLSSQCADQLAPIVADGGLQQAATAPLMVLTAPAAQAIEHGFVVQRVSDTARLSVVADLVASAFSLDRMWVGRTFVSESLLEPPSVSFFLASKDDEPCSAVTTTCTRTGVVGIWSMATAPERQRRGAGRAVLRAAVAHHLRQGAEAFYLIATPAGKPLYDSFGFTTVDEFPVWVAGESEQFGEPVQRHAQ
jgi:GNAT superfamily N-acetyltransferase